MGLFDRWKKAQKANTQSTTPRTAASAGAQKTAQSFYTDCVEVFHNEAMKNGFAKRGVIFIPELIPMGEKAVLAFLQDQFFAFEFGNNPAQYYYVILSLAIQAGIAFGEKWHLDFSGLKNGYVDQMIEEGPADEANRILTDTIGLVGNQQQNEFYQKIYEKWIECHEPYWALSDPRQYTFNAMLAGYQLGISMILEKYGL